MAIITPEEAHTSLFLQPYIGPIPFGRRKMIPPKGFSTQDATVRVTDRIYNINKTFPNTSVRIYPHSRDRGFIYVGPESRFFRLDHLGQRYKINVIVHDGRFRKRRLVVKRPRS